MSPMAMASEVVSGLGFVAGALMFTSLMEMNTPLFLGGRTDLPRCPTCNGTRKVPCICRRWSDGDDSGCSSCSHTGMRTCSSCGGSGRGRHVPVKLRVSNARGPRRFH